MKQTPVCVLCDWLISNSTSKDDIKRWLSKDNRYARNTERGYKETAKIASKIAYIHVNPVKIGMEWNERNLFPGGKLKVLYANKGQSE